MIQGATLRASSAEVEVRPEVLAERKTALGKIGP